MFSWAGARKRQRPTNIRRTVPHRPTGAGGATSDFGREGGGAAQPPQERPPMKAGGAKRRQTDHGATAPPAPNGEGTLTAPGQRSVA